MAVAADHGVQPLPQLHVFYGLFGSRAPATRLPAVDPLGNAFAHVFTVEVQRDLTRALEHGQAFNHGQQFHAVVGGAQLATKHLFFVRTGFQPDPPAARARVAFTCAVGINFHVVQKKFLKGFQG